MRYVWLTTMLLAVLLAAACRRSGEQDAAPPAQPAVPASSGASGSVIGQALTGAGRLAGDSEEDAWRKPAELLAFLDPQPGWQVLDFFAGGGYYSELLARIVGPEGKVIAYNNKGYADFAAAKLKERFDAGRLPAVQPMVVETGAMTLDASSLDAVLFVMSYHDLYWTPKGASAPMGDARQVTALLFNALKPGGVVVVQDHVAAAGGDTSVVAGSLHRIDPAVVKSDFESAGFVFEAESGMLRHPDDDYSKVVFDEAVSRRTDQFVYRFRKP